ncbi:MAG: PIN domain-containing protein [Actinomycetota bacterium]|nr:PIN domain-containing protein [Actinomycetota bacterium]
MIVYDAGALVAAERNERTMWALHDSVLRRGLSPLVPVGVLAQVWRGGPQASLSRLLSGCVITPLDERLARAAGVLCGKAGSADVIDASVIALAQLLDAAVVTGDAHDLQALADAVGFDITLQQI